MMMPRITTLPWRPSNFSASRPPGCNSSPTMRSGCFISRSMTLTFRPSLARTVASAEPATPDPIIITSGLWLENFWWFETGGILLWWERRRKQIEISYTLIFFLYSKLVAIAVSFFFPFCLNSNHFKLEINFNLFLLNYSSVHVNSYNISNLYFIVFLFACHF